MYKAEAGARPILTKLANEVRESGEDNAEEIAALIEGYRTKRVGTLIPIIER